MIDRRRDLVMLWAALATTSVLAIAGSAWIAFAPPIAEGDTMRKGVAAGVSFAGPAFVVTLWLLGAPARRWLAVALDSASTCTLGPDTVRGLRRHRAVLRIYIGGFCALIAAMQIVAIAAGTGLAPPGGAFEILFARAFFLASGALFVFVGNASPRVPYVANPWIDATRHHKSMRFAGWVFVVGGALAGLAALSAPFERLQFIVLGLCAGMMALVAVHGAAQTLAFRREARPD